MQINSLFWIFILLAFLGTALYYFGRTLINKYKEIIEFSGGIITFGVLIASFFFLGWKTSLLLIIIELIIISFVSAYIVEFLTKKHIR